ncbi:MAG: efflux transporter periplasmic adaptor subunit, partial [Muribaculaceae bacterium]|nr:efflux transporter periplasmic adaptor subunit [Muribaculaceae bacterium]
LGQPVDAVVIPKGSFYSGTGGKWIFVLDPSGRKAYRRNIRLGRQNPEYYEVLEGLEPGERVIVNGYESYGDATSLTIE